MPKKIIKKKKKKREQIVSSQANISDKPFDQKSPEPPEEGVLVCHRQTNKQTDRGFFLLLGGTQTFYTEWNLVTG